MTTSKAGLLAVFALALLCQTGAAQEKSAADWPQFRRTATHTAFNVDETAIRKDSVSKLTLVDSLSASTVNVSGGLILAGSSAGLTAFSEATRETKWQADLKVDYWPAIADGVVFSVGGGKMTAVDLKSGKRKWFRAISESEGSPLVRGAVVYIRAGDGYTALDAANGKVLWRKTLSVAQEGCITKDHFVFVSGSKTTVVNVLDPMTGSVKWTAKLPEAPGVSMPACTSGGIFVPTEKSVFLVSLDTRKIAGRFPAEDSAISVGDDVLVAASMFDGNVAAYRISDRKRLWKRDLQRNFDYYRDYPAIINDLVFIPRVGGIFALDMNSGKTLWSKGTKKGRYNYKIYAHPVVANGRLYVEREGGVHVFELGK